MDDLDQVSDSLAVLVHGDTCLDERVFAAIVEGVAPTADRGGADEESIGGICVRPRVGVLELEDLEAISGEVVRASMGACAEESSAQKCVGLLFDVERVIVALKGDDAAGDGVAPALEVASDVADGEPVE